MILHDQLGFLCMNLDPVLCTLVTTHKVIKA